MREKFKSFDYYSSNIRRNEGGGALEIFLVVVEASPCVSAPIGELVTIFVKVVREDGWTTEEHTDISTGIETEE